MPLEKFNQTNPENREQNALALKLAELKKIAGELEQKNIPPEKQREQIAAAIEIMKEIFSAGGGEYFEDVNGLYKTLKGQQMLVRRENPLDLTSAITEQKNLDLSFDTKVKHKYANCAEWNYEQGTDGLNNAFLEGFSHLGGIVTIVGFDKGDLKVEDIAAEHQQLYNLNRRTVKSAEGSVPVKNIKFIVMAAPISLYPENDLTGQEEEMLDEMKQLEEGGKKEAAKRAGARRVFRGFRFN